MSHSSKVFASVTVAGMLTLVACGGGSSSDSAEGLATTVVASAPTPADTSSPDSSSAGTTPAPAPTLLDPSTDLDAIDSPIVLWFWSPG